MKNDVVMVYVVGLKIDTKSKTMIFFLYQDETRYKDSVLNPHYARKNDPQI